MKPGTMFEACGRSLFGDRWRSGLAREMGVTERTVRRYADGQTPVPKHRWKQVSDLMLDRAAMIRAFEREAYRASRGRL